MPGFRVRWGVFLIMLVVSIVVIGCAATPTAPSPTAPIVPTQSPTRVDSTVAPTATPTPPSLPTSTPTNTVAPTLTPTVAPSATSPAEASPVAEATVVDDTVRLVVVSERSQARYRVREQLAGVSLPSDAVGSTSVITGTIVGEMDGSIVSTESRFVVDLRTLKSDRAQRDNFLRRNTLQTDQYPYATFVPASASGLPTTLPSSGQVSFKLIGALTIRDVTQEVVWEATCEVQGNEATCHARTNFPFAYFNLTQPRVPVVLSVEDNIVLEVDVVLQRVGG